jgi:DNA-binding NtrC family response regulator
MAASDRHSAPHVKQILICDDDPLFRKTLTLLLRDYGAITAVQDSDEALALLQARTFDLLILDVQMRTAEEGVLALPKFRALDPNLTILMLSGRKDFGIVRQALRDGADDYLVKDFEPEEFRLTLERAIGKNALQKSNRRRGAETTRMARRYRLVGESAPIVQVRKLAEKFRASGANVLIRGETGSGKEIVARLLRKTEADDSFEPFVAIDSATLHSHTAESVLFGHEKGAFTGADRARQGLFEEADGGVIFFDEIANMPVEIQAKLLRVLQEREIIRLGSNRPIPLSFRVVAATNRPLEEMAKSGGFLPDLLQRLNVLPIMLPPLRDRREDIPLLTEYFLSEKAGGRVSMSEAAIDALTAYEWPGNVRELSAMLEYSLALIEDQTIDLADLHPRLLERRPSPTLKSESFYAQVAAHEAEILGAAYARSEGNISQLALRLGMDRSHLHTKLKLYGIHPAKKSGTP